MGYEQSVKLKFGVWHRSIEAKELEQAKQKNRASRRALLSEVKLELTSDELEFVHDHDNQKLFQIFDDYAGDQAKQTKLRGRWTAFKGEPPPRFQTTSPTAAYGPATGLLTRTADLEKAVFGSSANYTDGLLSRVKTMEDQVLCQPMDTDTGLESRIANLELKMFGS